jgi:hypothetical protein
MGMFFYFGELADKLSLTVVTVFIMGMYHKVRISTYDVSLFIITALGMLVDSVLAV